MILYESQYYGVQIMDFDPIVHHGIKGQKWGVTNGPPYPLGFKARERVREKAKQIKARLSGNKSSGGKKRGLSDKTKARIKTGLKVAGTAAVVGAAAYGAYKLSELGVPNSSFMSTAGSTMDKTVEDLKQSVNSNSNSFSSGLFNKDKAEAISKVTGFKVKDMPDDLATNVQKANPGYVGGKNDPLRNNCAHSVISWFLNETGLDVKAMPMSIDEIDGGITPSEFRGYFKDCKLQSTKLPKSTSDLDCKKYLASTIKSQYNGENSAGMFCMATPTGRHFMGWVMKDKKVSFVDPQPGKTNASIWFKAYAQGLTNDGVIDFARLDNLELRVPKIKRAVQNA